MRIRMLINVTDGSGIYQRGQVLDLPEAEAYVLVSRGRAVPLEREVTPRFRGNAPEVSPVPVESEALGEPEETMAESKPRRKRKAG